MGLFCARMMLGMYRCILGFELIIGLGSNEGGLLTSFFIRADNEHFRSKKAQK